MGYQFTHTSTDMGLSGRDPKLYAYNLPQELIAQTPASPRDSARLLVYSRYDRSITDDVFSNLQEHLRASTTVVVNDTSVRKARLKFLYGKVETFLLEEDGSTAWALVFPGKKFTVGATVGLDSSLSVEVLAVNKYGHRQLRFSESLASDVFDPFRQTPLPPYIEHDEALAVEYQTVFKDSAGGGSVAAPTAGLHFTPTLQSSIQQDHPWTSVTLDVGLGTFAPLKKEQLESGRLHEERYIVSSSAVRQLQDAKHITAVGTTSARVLESLSAPLNASGPLEGATDIFISPGYDFSYVDSLITNFHLPETSLMMMVAALTGREELLRIYNHAVAQKYRFFSFGDAMIVV